MASPCYLCTALPLDSAGRPVDPVGLSSFLVDPGAEPVDARMRREEDRVRGRQQDQHADTAYNMANGQLTADVVDASEQLLVRGLPRGGRAPLFYFDFLVKKRTIFEVSAKLHSLLSLACQ